jgi:cytochrome c5
MKRGEREEVVMMKLPVLLALAAGLTLAACDNSTPPTKAPADQNPQVDKNTVPQSTTDGDQPGTPKQ